MSNYAPNSTTNMDIMKTRKTRIEALNDRINDADNYLNNFLPEEGKENFQILIKLLLIRKLLHYRVVALLL